nr:MAG TPA: hypothetical protein [Caudoviricetes sp.]
MYTSSDMQIIAYAEHTANRSQLAFWWCRNPQKIDRPAAPPPSLNIRYFCR